MKRREVLFGKIKDDFEIFKTKHSNKLYVSYSIVPHAKDNLEGKIENLQEAEKQLQEVETMFQSFRQFRDVQVLGLEQSYERLADALSKDGKKLTLIDGG